MLRLTALMDNLPSENKALIAEHGLSVLVEKDGGRILFDCGASGSTWRNARRLGADINSCLAVVISHSHYDHAAGYRDLMEGGCTVKTLWTGEHFFEKKYSFDGVWSPSVERIEGKYTDLSAGWGEDFIAQHGVRRRVVSGIEEILPSLWLVTGFERGTAFENIPSKFVKETAADMVLDDFADEVCIAAETERGLVVLAGCSHPGIVNMVRSVKKKLCRPIYAVFGGVHLNNESESCIADTLRSLKEEGTQLFGFSHCSGQAVEDMAAERFGKGYCLHLAVGDCVIL